MANLNHAGSFTNIPELKGQIDPDTGKKWQFMPELLWWRDYQKEKGASIAQTKEGRIIAESPETGGYAGKPEKQSEARAGLDQLKKKAIDLTALKKKPEKPSIPDRTSFIKEFVLPRLGGVDPYTVNVPQKAEQMYSKNIDKAFKQVFPDIPIGGMLTEEQQKHWQKINEQLRQHYYNWSKKENDFQKDLWGHMMAEYEKGAAEIKAKEIETRRVAEKQFKETPTEERAAEQKVQISKERRANIATVEKEQRDYKRKIETEIRKELREAGKTKELTRTDYTILTSAYLGLMKAIEDGDEGQSKLRINSINKIRQSLGLKPMKMQKTPGKDKYKLLGMIPIPLTGASESKEYIMDFGLPSGLTEKDIEYNMNKYHKTRKEVINKFKGTK